MAIFVVPLNILVRAIGRAEKILVILQLEQMPTCLSEDWLNCLIFSFPVSLLVPFSESIHSSDVTFYLYKHPYQCNQHRWQGV